jgi:hypothetical protein
MKKLNEKRVNPDLLKLNTSQKRVLMKTVEAGDPKRAANVTDDPALRTDDETEESEPGPGPAEPGTGGEEMGLGNVGAELGKPPSNGDDMGLELSSYFREIHNWTRILKD